jgi:hypothetical protein
MTPCTYVNTASTEHLIVQSLLPRALRDVPLWVNCLLVWVLFIVVGQIVRRLLEVVFLVAAALLGIAFLYLTVR